MRSAGVPSATTFGRLWAGFEFLAHRLLGSFDGGRSGTDAHRPAQAGRTDQAAGRLAWCNVHPRPSGRHAVHLRSSWPLAPPRPLPAVWVGKVRSKAAFEDFFTALGPDRAAKIEAISLDGSGVYLRRHPRTDPTSTNLPRLVPRHHVDQRSRRIGLPRGGAYPARRSRMPERRIWRRAASPSTLAARTSTTTTGRSSGCCAGNAAGFGAPGNSKNNCATSTAPSTRATRGLTSSDGAPPRKTYPHCCVREPRAPHRKACRCHRRRRRTRPIQLAARRHQRQNPARPTTRLRLPRPRCPNRSHLPLPGRSHFESAHPNPSSRTPVRMPVASRVRQVVPPAATRMVHRAPPRLLQSLVRFSAVEYVPASARRHLPSLLGEREQRVAPSGLGTAYARGEPTCRWQRGVCRHVAASA